MLKKILFTAFISFTAVSAIAKTQASAPIDLGGGTVNPHQVTAINLNKLIENIDYIVICNATDTNNDKNKMIIAITAKQNRNFGSVYINGEQVGIGGFQGDLSAVKNKIQISGVDKHQGSINFTNADDDDTLVIDNCTAYISKFA